MNPVVGGFLILSCVIFLTFVVLNLFIAVILEAFSHEQKHYKVTCSIPLLSENVEKRNAKNWWESLEKLGLYVMHKV